MQILRQIDMEVDRECNAQQDAIHAVSYYLSHLFNLSHFHPWTYKKNHAYICN
jgi:hypothetical protein